MNDLRYAFRQFAKSPGFAFAAILTLALGIGANTAIFSAISAIHLKPLPYPEPNQIVQIDEAPNTGGFGATCGGVFMDWEDHSTQFEAIAAYAWSTKNLTGEGEPIRLSGLAVSAQYLNVLGVNPEIGRGFIAADDAPGGNRNVTIISYELWQTRFHGDPTLIGRAIRLDGESFTVIGVLASQALFATNADYLMPATIRADAWKQSREYHFVCQAIARLKAGVTPTQATAELTTAKQALNSSYPDFKQPWGVAVRPLREALFGDSRSFNTMLFIAVALVLLIACANVANLLLARATARQGEIAIRLSLGASRWRIIRQLLIESMLLASAGGSVGIWLGTFAIAPLNAFTGLDAIPGLTVSIDYRVLTFTLVATLATGLLFGLLPALSATRPDLQTCPKEGTRGSTGGTSRRLQSLLTISETALTVVLLIAAGLLLRSFGKAMNADAGFNHENVLIFSLSQPGTKAPTNDHRVRFTNEILRSLEKISGVSKVGEASSTPMNGTYNYNAFVRREDRPETRSSPNAGFDAVNGDFFQAVEIPLLRGRFFTEADNSEKAPKTVIINNALAHKLYNDENPIGQFLHIDETAREIVGVVGDVRQFGLDYEPVPQVYYPQVQFPWVTTYVVRTLVPPLTLAAEIRRAVQAVDPEQPIFGLQTLTQSVTDSLRGRKIMLSLFSGFAITALILACIGIYGVTSYSVAQRTRELGIRIALGAQVKNVVGIVLQQGLKLAAIGVVIGLVVAVAAGRAFTAFLYDVSPFDAATFAGVPIVLMAVTLLACWLPARRATKVDPIEALRAE